MKLGRSNGRAGLVMFTIAAAFIAVLLFPRHESASAGPDRFRPAFGIAAGQVLDYVPAPNPGAGPASSPTPALASAEHLNFGQTVKRTFQPGTSQLVFTFQAQAGDLITITMTADPNGSLDPALVLLGPDGKPVAQNDDSLDPAFGLSNARLLNFPIRASGQYTIQALHSTVSGGGFTLTLRGKSTGPSAVALNYGDSSQGTISDSVVRVFYRFQAAQGDVITIVVQSVSGSRLLPYVTLLDSSGSKLADSNPNATTKVARITSYPIKSDGTYTVAVGRVGEEEGTTTGGFKVTLSLESSSDNTGQKSR